MLETLYSKSRTGPFAGPNAWDFTQGHSRDGTRTANGPAIGDKPFANAFGSANDPAHVSAHAFRSANDLARDAVVIRRAKRMDAE